LCANRSQRKRLWHGGSFQSTLGCDGTKLVSAETSSANHSCDRGYQNLCRVVAPQDRKVEGLNGALLLLPKPVVTEEALAVKSCVILVRMDWRETTPPNRKSTVHR